MCNFLGKYISKIIKVLYKNIYKTKTKDEILYRGDKNEKINFSYNASYADCKWMW